jgi:hypothetical protein
MAAGGPSTKAADPTAAMNVAYKSNVNNGSAMPRKCRFSSADTSRGASPGRKVLREPLSNAIRNVSIRRSSSSVGRRVDDDGVVVAAGASSVGVAINKSYTLPFKEKKNKNSKKKNFFFFFFFFFSKGAFFFFFFFFFV